ncbi:MAG: prepilin-type N-terminal cleavage/methylation domain-containing protein [bacterium]|nr:prepilin-type N-terminal cleavage/methylation domain-containing protein [bacterium]
MNRIFNFKLGQTGRKGFTLIELLVVIAIIGVLASVVLVSLNNARMKARDAKRIADFKQIQTALELFYDQTGKYPQSPGHATWSGHWAYFSECLVAGTNCGFTISNYTSVVSKIPQDPSRITTDPFANDVTYYPGYPTGCSDGKSYRLAVQLETNNPALQSSVTGSFYNNNSGCNPASRWYCVGVGTCGGW